MNDKFERAYIAQSGIDVDKVIAFARARVDRGFPPLTARSTLWLCGIKPVPRMLSLAIQVVYMGEPWLKPLTFRRKHV